MARIDGVPAAAGGLVARIAYRVSKREYGVVPESLTVAARHRWLLAAYVAFEGLFARAHHVDRRLKNLAALRAATLIGCEFCIDIGSFDAIRSGLTSEQLRALPDYRENDQFTDLEKLVLDYATAMTRTPADVPEALTGALRNHLGDEQLLELTGQIALENYRARFNAAIGIAAQGFSEAGACARPERPAPVAGPAGSR